MSAGTPGQSDDGPFPFRHDPVPIRIVAAPDRQDVLEQEADDDQLTKDLNQSKAAVPVLWGTSSMWAKGGGLR